LAYNRPRSPEGE